MKSLLLGFLLLTATLFGTPYRIIVIPPAEGPSKKNPYNHVAVGPSGPIYQQGLSALGQRRASYLVGYFLGLPGKKPLFPDMVSRNPIKAPIHPITFIGAYFTEGGAGTFRPVETISPLANVIFYEQASTTFYQYSPPSVKQFSTQMIKQLKQNLHLIAHTAVICWKSQDITSLLTALEPSIEKNESFQKAFPRGKFPKDDPSNLTFVITYDETLPSFAVYRQEKEP